MIIKISKRLTGAVLLLGFAVYLLTGVKDANSLSYLMPQLYAYLLIAASIGLIIQFIVLRKKDAQDAFTINCKGFWRTGGFRIFVYALMILAYYILMSIVGFVVSTVLFLFASYWFLSVRKASVYMISLAVAALLYCLFTFALKVDFPHGLLY